MLSVTPELYFWSVSLSNTVSIFCLKTPVHSSLCCNYSGSVLRGKTKEERIDKLTGAKEWWISHQCYLQPWWVQCELQWIRLWALVGFACVNTPLLKNTLHAQVHHRSRNASGGPVPCLLVSLATMSHAQKWRWEWGFCIFTVVQQCPYHRSYPGQWWLSGPWHSGS